MAIKIKKQYLGNTAVLHGINIKLDEKTSERELKILAEKLPRVVYVEKENNEVESPKLAKKN